MFKLGLKGEKEEDTFVQTVTPIATREESFVQIVTQMRKTQKEPFVQTVTQCENDSERAIRSNCD